METAKQAHYWAVSTDDVDHDHGVNNNNKTRVFIINDVLLSISGSSCQFPPEWRGQWHEGRRTEISATGMTRKGTCMENDGNKYFMLNS